MLCLNDQVSQETLDKDISGVKDLGYRVLLFQPGKQKNFNELYKAGGRDQVAQALMSSKSPKKEIDRDIKMIKEDYQFLQEWENKVGSSEKRRMQKELETEIKERIENDRTFKTRLKKQDPGLYKAVNNLLKAMKVKDKAIQK